MAELVASFDVKFDLKRYPYELSGGQQQTASIMRALAPEPRGAVPRRAVLGARLRDDALHPREAAGGLHADRHHDAAGLARPRGGGLPRRPGAAADQAADAASPRSCRTTMRARAPWRRCRSRASSPPRSAAWRSSSAKCGAERATSGAGTDGSRTHRGLRRRRRGRARPAARRRRIGPASSHYFAPRRGWPTLVMAHAARRRRDEPAAGVRADRARRSAGFRRRRRAAMRRRRALRGMRRRDRRGVRECARRERVGDGRGEPGAHRRHRPGASTPSPTSSRTARAGVPRRSTRRLAARRRRASDAPLPCRRAVRGQEPVRRRRPDDARRLEDRARAAARDADDAARRRAWSARGRRPRRRASTWTSTPTASPPRTRTTARPATRTTSLAWPAAPAVAAAVAAGEVPVTSARHQRLDPRAGVACGAFG